VIVFIHLKRTVVVDSQSLQHGPHAWGGGDGLQMCQVCVCYLKHFDVIILHLTQHRHRLATFRSLYVMSVARSDL
jgi:hypothetical protein